MTTETPVISVRFTNELDDHLKAQRLLYRKSVMAKIDKAVSIGLFLFGVYAVYVVGPRWWTLIWFPLSVAEWFDLFSPRAIRTRIEFRRNPKYREEYHLTFSPDNIHFKTASIDSILQWTHYERFIESADLFLLLYGKGPYTLIPKRCFSSEDEVTAFRALLDKKILAKGLGAA